VIGVGPFLVEIAPDEETELACNAALVPLRYAQKVCLPSWRHAGCNERFPARWVNDGFQDASFPLRFAAFRAQMQRGGQKRREPRKTLYNYPGGKSPGLVGDELEVGNPLLAAPDHVSDRFLFGFTFSRSADELGKVGSCSTCLRARPPRGRLLGQ
jgi:hypothetical protein